jgi:hypothetical protein
MWCPNDGVSINFGSFCRNVSSLHIQVSECQTLVFPFATLSNYSFSLREQHYRGEARQGVSPPLVLALSSIPSVVAYLIRQFLHFQVLHFSELPLFRTRARISDNFLPPPSLQAFASLNDALR